MPGGGQKSRNVASLLTELNNGSTNIEGVDKDHMNEIKKKSKEAGLNQNKNKGDTATNLSVETLNNILKYLPRSKDLLKIRIFNFIELIANFLS